MQDSDIPAKFPIPWANAAGGPYLRNIPTSSQIGIQNGAASLTDGFPPNCFIPISGGGSWPWAQDFNGILKQITQWNRWQQAGAPIYYDSAFQTAIGGYPKGSIVRSAVTDGLLWESLVDNNTTNPDTGGAGWRTSRTNYAVWKMVSGVQMWSLNGASFTATGATSFTSAVSGTGLLKVAGGGGGTGGAAGSGASGGGAAGSYGEASILLVAGTPIAVSIGAGGLHGATQTSDGSAGGSTTFGGITAPGGLPSLHAVTGVVTTGGATGGPVTGTGIYLSQSGTPGANGGSIAVTGGGGGILLTPGSGAASRFGQGNYANTAPFNDNWGAGAGGVLSTLTTGADGTPGVAILVWQ